MERKIVVINEEKCTGCGLCARACHEGAIKMIEGKAHLISESYCDGLLPCLSTGWKMYFLACSVWFYLESGYRLPLCGSDCGSSSLR